MKAAVVGAFLALSCWGCTTRVGEFSVVSHRATIDAPAVAPVVGKDVVTGRSCRKVILLFIPLGPTADLSDAFDAALASAPGANALTDVTVRRETLITILYNEHCFVVEGKPVSFEREPPRASR